MSKTGFNVNIRCLIHKLSEIWCNGDYKQFLGTFTKFQKATVNFIMFVCPSLCLHGTPWLPLDIFSGYMIIFFFKSVEKIEVLLKFDKNDGYLA